MINKIQKKIKKLDKDVKLELKSQINKSGIRIYLAFSFLIIGFVVPKIRTLQVFFNQLLVFPLTIVAIFILLRISSRIIVGFILFLILISPLLVINGNVYAVDMFGNTIFFLLALLIIKELWNIRRKVR